MLCLIMGAERASEFSGSSIRILWYLGVQGVSGNHYLMKTVHYTYMHLQEYYMYYCMYRTLSGQAMLT